MKGQIVIVKSVMVTSFAVFEAISECPPVTHTVITPIFIKSGRLPADSRGSQTGGPGIDLKIVNMFFDNTQNLYHRFPRSDFI